MATRPRFTVWALLVPIVGLIAGIIFSGARAASGGTNIRGDVSDVADLIRKQTAINKEYAGQVATIQREVDDLTNRAQPGDTALADLRARGDALADPAGRTAVKGPALEVVLDDSRLRGDQIPEGMTVDDIVVHQQDVQAVVNAMWRGGAEAMMLMDQRVISTSAVRCVGNTLILQGRVYSPPFKITAIGDVTAMRQALVADPQVAIYREYVAAAGLRYDVVDRGVVQFPAFEGSIRPRYAVAAATAK